MESFMRAVAKKITLMAIATMFASTLSVNANAGFVSDDAKNLKQCRHLLETKVGEVDRIKTSNIKSKSRSFTVKYNVVNNDARSTFQCKLQRDKVDIVTCLKGSLCSSEGVASKGQ